jgi:hypothetical protein
MKVILRYLSSNAAKCQNTQFFDIFSLKEQDINKRIECSSGVGAGHNQCGKETQR